MYRGAKEFWEKGVINKSSRDDVYVKGKEIWTQKT